MNLFSKLALSIKALRELLYEKREELINRERNDDCFKKKYSKLYDNVRFGTDCSMGRHSFVSYNTIVSNCDIGNYCSIGPNNVIGFGDHPLQRISTCPAFYYNLVISGRTFVTESNFIAHRKIIIGNDVWIGANTYIKGGVTIGDGAVIAAGAVVIEDVAPYCIVGGVPAKQIRKRFSDEIIQYLMEIKWWEWEDKKIERVLDFFVTENVEGFIAWCKQNNAH